MWESTPKLMKIGERGHLVRMLADGIFADKRGFFIEE